MYSKLPVTFRFAFLLAAFAAVALAATDAAELVKVDVVTISAQQQYAELKPASDSAVAIEFELEKGWYFYASPKTAPGGMNIKIVGSSNNTAVTFSDPVLPAGKLYVDKTLNKELEILSGKFTIFLPFGLDASARPGTARISIQIEGAVCRDIQCRVPDFVPIETVVKINPAAAMDKPAFTISKPQEPIASTGLLGDRSVVFALTLALIAGLILNIMPCIWPVLPIIVMRIVEQGKQKPARATAMGLAFCCGILLFFAALAAANIILQVFYGTVLQWGDQFRNPAFVAAMALLLVVLALFMFDVFTFTIPSAVAGKAGTGKGYTGAVGMGFLAAVLSTPCSFAILATAFAWAQAQPLALATVAIMVIGIGMALPYAILTSMPSLLQKLPKAGKWMELFKQTVGFILLIIAVKLLTALPQAKLSGALYFAVILSFCVWMWGSWVSYNTKLARKWLIRGIAVALAIFAGWVCLGSKQTKLIDWQPYDTTVVEQAVAEKRPVLLKFTADWCLSCQVVEKTVYANKDIARLIEEKKVLAIKADTTAKDFPATKALKNIYHEPGVPVTILLLPGRTKPLRWHGMVFANDLKTHLRDISY